MKKLSSKKLESDIVKARITYVYAIKKYHDDSKLNVLYTSFASNWFLSSSSLLFLFFELLLLTNEYYLSLKRII